MALISLYGWQRGRMDGLMRDRKGKCEVWWWRWFLTEMYGEGGTKEAKKLIYVRILESPLSCFFLIRLPAFRHACQVMERAVIQNHMHPQHCLYRNFKPILTEIAGMVWHDNDGKSWEWMAKTNPGVHYSGFARNNGWVYGETVHWWQNHLPTLLATLLSRSPLCLCPWLFFSSLWRSWFCFSSSYLLPPPFSPFLPLSLCVTFCLSFFLSLGPDFAFLPPLSPPSSSILLFRLARHPPPHLLLPALHIHDHPALLCHPQHRRHQRKKEAHHLQPHQQEHQELDVIRRLMWVMKMQANHLEEKAQNAPRRRSDSLICLSLSPFLSSWSFLLEEGEGEEEEEMHANHLERRASAGWPRRRPDSMICLFVLRFWFFWAFRLHRSSTIYAYMSEVEKRQQHADHDHDDCLMASVPFVAFSLCDSHQHQGGCCWCWWSRDDHCLLAWLFHFCILPFAFSFLALHQTTAWSW